MNQAFPEAASLTVRNVGIATAARIAVMKTAAKAIAAKTRTFLAKVADAVEVWVWVGSRCPQIGAPYSGAPYGGGAYPCVPAAASVGHCGATGEAPGPGRGP